MRTSLSGHHTQPKGGGVVAEPGLKGHRILRRVLGGGRHLRTSRAIGFHESVVTATLAVLSRGRRSRNAPCEHERPTAERRPCPTPTEEGDATEVSEAWSIAGAVGRKRPRCSLRTPDTVHAEDRQKQAARVSLRSAEAFSSVVKTLGPPVKHRSPRLLCLPRGESRGANRERTKYGCT